MGNLHRMPIAAWRTRYGLQAMGETGTWEGKGVTTALGAGYPLVVTTDAVPTRAAMKLRSLEGVVWYLRCSSEAMPAMLADIGSFRALWWLDAHLPERYQAPDSTLAPRTPLLAEVAAIVHSARSHARDIIVADDMRLYGRECEDGPMPSGIKRANRDDLDTILELLEPTHTVSFDPRDTGYLVALPG